MTYSFVNLFKFVWNLNSCLFFIEDVQKCLALWINKSCTIPTEIKVLVIYAIVESDYIMYTYLKKDLVSTAPKGGPFSAGGSKLLSVVIQWSQNVLDIKAALTWPHKLLHMQKIIIFLQMKFCGAKFSLGRSLDSYENYAFIKAFQIS